MTNRISFIVASLARGAQLQSCIASIEKAHNYKPDIAIEILVVIQGKQQKDIKIACPEITKVYYIDRTGLSVARNFGIEKSNGDYLVFLDDDAQVSENFIETLSQKVLLYGQINAFCGRLMDAKQKIPFSTLFYNEKVKKIGWLDFQYFMGSAHVLSAKVIKKIGGYDERFGVGGRYYGSEETDIFFRLKAKGEQVIYLPELVFFHPIPVTPPDYVYKYAYAIAAMLTKACFSDKRHMFIYCFILLQRFVKFGIRILQKLIFGGVYLEKDKKCHYGSLLKGTFKGVSDFVAQEL